jgi:bifunctional ADP-heptose synthase (sugar kinase/adenylyltransferase)
MKSFVQKEMAVSGIDLDASIDPSRATTQKNVFIADEYRLLKLDKVDNRPISGATLEQFKDSLSSSQADAIVFSDFRHGIFNRSTIPQLTGAISKGPLRVADTQVASRWGNILDFQEFDLITPNEREARFALGDQDSVIRPLALELFKQTKCKMLILKLGDRGILTYREPSPGNLRGFFVIDSLAGNVVDPVGAGDALLAYSTLSMATTHSPVEASILGSMAAATACEREGNVPVTPGEVLKKIDALEQRSYRL